MAFKMRISQRSYFFISVSLCEFSVDLCNKKKLRTYTELHRGEENNNAFEMLSGY